MQKNYQVHSINLFSVYFDLVDSAVHYGVIELKKEKTNILIHCFYDNSLILKVVIEIQTSCKENCYGIFKIPISENMYKEKIFDMYLSSLDNFVSSEYKVLIPTTKSVIIPKELSNLYSRFNRRQDYDLIIILLTVALCIYFFKISI